MFFLFSVFNRRDLFCHQEEADTRIFYNAKVLDQEDDIDAIVIDAEDADVRVIVAYVSTIL